MKFQFFIFYVILSIFQLLVTTPLLASGSLKNDSTATIIIQDIILEGNKVTKDKIILREIPFAPGDTLFTHDTIVLFKQIRYNLNNLTLFNKSTLYCEANEDSTVYVFKVVVDERWYIFPIPILELADRNFNEWWVDRGRDLRRIEYGIRFRHENFRGRNERLKIILQGGFTNKYELIYTLPYVDRKQRTGLGINFTYTQNKQVAYRTEEHKLAFVRDEEILRVRFNTGLTLSHRHNYFATHKTKLVYHQNRINDTIAYLNPQYFGDDRTIQRYLEMSYEFIYDRRDFRSYPLKGHFFRALATQLGTGIFNDINQSMLEVSVARYHDFGRGYFGGVRTQGKLSTPTNQPYFNTRGLGYGEELVRGYELYVIDGQHFLYTRTEFKKQLLNIELDVSKLFKIKQFNKIPYQVFIKTFIDGGYVHDGIYNSLNTELSNTPMWGAGLGIDVVSYYDSAIRLEYSINSLYQFGFFVHVFSAL